MLPLSCGEGRRCSADTGLVGYTHTEVPVVFLAAFAGFGVMLVGPRLVRVVTSERTVKRRWAFKTDVAAALAVLLIGAGVLCLIQGLHWLHASYGPLQPARQAVAQASAMPAIGLSCLSIVMALPVLHPRINWRWLVAAAAMLALTYGFLLYRVFTIG